MTAAAGRERHSVGFGGPKNFTQVSDVDGQQHGRSTSSGSITTPLTIEAAAARLGVTPRLVRRLVNERRIGFVRVGKFIRLRPKDLDAYLEEHFQPPLDHRPGS